MGITIHYKGKLKSPGLIEQVRDELEDIAKDMGWRYSIFDEDLNKPNTAKLVVDDSGGNITGHLPLKGIIIYVHKDCEPLTFYFDKNGFLRNIIAMATDEKDDETNICANWVKTQFAPLDVHITIIKLFKYLKEKYFAEFEVFDEGDYWDTGDKNILKAKMDFLSERINEVEKILSESNDELNNIKSPDELANKLEEILQKKLGKDSIRLTRVQQPKKKK